MRSTKLIAFIMASLFTLLVLSTHEIYDLRGQVRVLTTANKLITKELKLLSEEKCKCPKYIAFPPEGLVCETYEEHLEASPFTNYRICYTWDKCEGFHHYRLLENGALINID